MRKQISYIFLYIIFFVSIAPINAQSILDYFPNINILESNNPSDGYFFVATKSFEDPNGSNYFAIFDNQGTPVYMRLLEGAGSGISKQSNGHLTLIDGSMGKVFFELDSMFQVVDTFMIDGYKTDGRDIDMDDNGNVILIGSENITVDMSVIVDGGNSAATIQDKLVQEFDGDNNLLYTWKAWDHYNILDSNSDSPLVDFTTSTIDYIHANSICFDSDTSFLFSARHFDEITKVDRRTGEVIWRLGGKKNQFTFVNDEVRFSHQHTIRRLPNGNIQLFDNGNMNIIQESSVVEYSIDEKAWTATQISRTRHNPAVYARKSGGQQKLYNGNLLIFWGGFYPSLTEYNPDGSVSLEMDFTNHSFSNRILKSKWKHRVFETHTDELNFGMWDGYSESQSLLNIKNNADSTLILSGYHTRTNHFYIEDSFPISIAAGEEKTLTVVYYPLNSQTGYVEDVLTLQAEYTDVYLAQQVRLKGVLEDFSEPVVTITPNTSGVDLNAQIQVSFTEAIRLIDDTELNYQNVDNLITLRKDGDQGELIDFDANVNTDKTRITLKPTNPLDDNQKYYVSFGDIYEDYSNNSVSGDSQTFNTGSLTNTNTLNPQQNNLLISPNPSSGQFQLAMVQKGDYKIVVLDMYSKLIIEQEVHNSKQIPIDLSQSSDGIYLVLVYSNSKLFSSQKIIKD